VLGGLRRGVVREKKKDTEEASGRNCIPTQTLLGQILPPSPYPLPALLYNFFSTTALHEIT